MKSELEQTAITCLAGRNAQEVFYTPIRYFSKHLAAIRGGSCQASPMPIHKSTGYNILEAVLRAQARGNEFESEWARLSKPLSPPPRPNQKQTNHQLRGEQQAKSK